MIGWVVLGLGLLIALFLVGRALVGARPADILKALRYVGASVFGLVAVVFALTGRLALAGPLAILATLFLRAGGRSPLPGFGGQGGRGPSAGNASEISTPCLRMILDHNSGEMTGTVLNGPHRGADLAALTFDQVIEVYMYLQAKDGEGATLLATYLERARPAEWEAWQQTGDHGRDRRTDTAEGVITPDEARRILGVGSRATVADVKAAHKRLMKKVHPDQGGSTYLASKINRAREILLEAMNRGASG